MKYFTAEWASGDLGEAEWGAVIPLYNRDLIEAFDADDTVRQFAEHVGLNDAYVDRIEWDAPARSLKLLLLTGSLQVGYWHTELIYRGVSAINGEDVLRAALAIRPSEIWYDEFYRDGDVVVHGFLLAPRGSDLQSAGEFAIRFSEFDCTQSRASGRNLKFDTDQSSWRDL